MRFLANAAEPDELVVMPGPVRGVTLVPSGRRSMRTWIPVDKRRD